MTTRVVGVHGIWNRQDMSAHDAAALLSSRWTAALLRGLGPRSRIETMVAYYAHHLGDETTQGHTDPAWLTQPEQELLLAWAEALGAPTEVAQGRLTQPALAAVDWIARRFRLDHALLRRLVATFCREVHTYLSDAARRGAVRDSVATTIASTSAADQPRVVLAHSLGSVVAYETLWARPDLQVDLLVTFGSPLGMPDVIFDRLDPAPVAGRGQRPPGVRRWINIADPGDIIAIPRGLAGSFAGIDADLTAPVGVFNAHKVTGYLSCTTTAAALATLLGR
jgi:hypothetical protein